MTNPKNDDPKFYVVVSRLGDKGKVNIGLCGALWARNASDAEIEAGRYREKLNYGAGSNNIWLGEDFYIVMAVKIKEAHQIRGFRTFKKQRVTDRVTKRLDDPSRRRASTSNNGQSHSL